MSPISIHDLFPGEIVLAGEKLAAWRAVLERGEPMAPIELIRIGGRTLVRDGNNRVRAFIEHHHGRDLPMIDSIWTSQTAPTPNQVMWLERASRYNGSGQGAFLGLPVEGPLDYEAAQTRQQNLIMLATK